jgi:hypothetical protein
MAKKDTKIAMLEEESSKHHAKTNSRYKLAIQEHYDELSQFKFVLEDLKARIARIDEYDYSRQPSKLEEEVMKVKGDLAIARGKILTSNNTIE